MSKGQKYDFERLENYCKENNVTLLEEYSVINLTRDFNIKSKCCYENCPNDVNKKFRELENTGSYCKTCIKLKAINMRKKTCLQRYGVENQSQSKIIQDKYKETCLKKYGVEHAFKSQKVKEKIKDTMLERYGVENPNQNAKIKNKIKETNLQKYGVEYASKY